MNQISAIEPRNHTTAKIETTEARLIDFIASAVDAAQIERRPFYHINLSGVFPADIYAAMLNAMPRSDDYRPMHGRSKRCDLADGTHTRVKIDLLPEYIRHLSPEKVELWTLVGNALCSGRVKEAFRRALAPPLEARFGKDFMSVGMYPIPILTRDIAGYAITPHTDTHWKCITVQIYLPRDEANPDIGTIFHRVLPDGNIFKAAQMRFVPNAGYAFAVGGDTWHSVSPVPHRVETRDSILLTYFVDKGPLMVLRNRGKRVGNFFLNEIRNRT